MSRSVKGIGLKGLFEILWKPDENEVDILEINDNKILEGLNIDKKTAEELADSSKKIKQLEEKYIKVEKKPKKKKRTSENAEMRNFKANIGKTKSQKEKDEDLTR